MAGQLHPRDQYDEDHEHDHPLKPHVINLFALFGLTGITYGVSLIHLGPLADIVAFAIAFSKATLVILVFMHVNEGTRLIKVTAFGGFFWIFLFFAYIVGDLVTRQNDTWFEGWQPEPRKAVVMDGGHHGDDHHGDDGDHADGEGPGPWADDPDSDY
ncbi:MAG: cytochrome C oxidase subunit IV family protein [Acidobacteriota bacterium]